MDDGSLGVFEGYRVQHNQHLYSGKSVGGICYHPQLDLDGVEAMAMQTSWKVGVLNLNSHSGAYGGIRCSPKEMSLTELERLTRVYTASMNKLFGDTQDFPKPDLGTNMQTMAWIEDQLREYDFWKTFWPEKPDNRKSFVLSRRDDTTAHGVVYATEALLAQHGKSIHDLTFAIQGLGNVGSSVAKLVHERGGKILAVSNSTAALKNANGIDIPSLLQHKEETGSLSSFDGGDNMNPNELLLHKCDVLIPCAVGGVLTRENASDVKAKFIIEAANNPTDPEADKILSKKGVIVLPDVYANAGGVTTEHYGLPNEAEKEVNDRLREQMNQAFVAIKQTCQENDCSLRLGAYALGISRAAEAQHQFEKNCDDLFKKMRGSTETASDQAREQARTQAQKQAQEQEFEDLMRKIRKSMERDN